MTMLILSIDPGITNCGVVVLFWDNTDKIARIIYSNTIWFSANTSINWFKTQKKINKSLKAILSLHNVDLITIETQPNIIRNNMQSRYNAINITVENSLIQFAICHSIPLLGTLPCNWHSKFKVPGRKHISKYKAQNFMFKMENRHLLEDVHCYDALLIAMWHFV